MAALARLGYGGIVSPCQQVVHLPVADLPNAAGLLLTSRNAVRALAALDPAMTARLRAGPVLCVGDATAQLARDRGFARAVSAGGDATDLARLVGRNCDAFDGPLLLATARGAGHPLVQALRMAGFRVVRRVVYDTSALPGLAAPAAQALAEDRVGYVLFHAGGAARLFVQALGAAGLAGRVAGVEALAISAAAAAPLGKVSWRKTRFPARPTEAAMLALLPAPAHLAPGPTR